MDSGKKPEKKNPRKGANPLSQLLFLWIVPLFWQGARKGLNNDDLTTCLKKHRSGELGNQLDVWVSLNSFSIISIHQGTISVNSIDFASIKNPFLKFNGDSSRS